MRIRTKILATLGPATSSREVLQRLVESGCDAFRINFSHGTYDQHEELLKNIRAVEAAAQSPICVCADLCGPKIRVGAIKDGIANLKTGDEITIQREVIEGTADRISTTLGELVDDVTPGESILIDDGKLRLEVVRTCPPDEIVCRVVVGGPLSSGKGVNLPKTQLKLSALTEKDRRDVEWIANHDFDYVCLSFVQHPDDIKTLRELLKTNGCDAHIIAKIEKPQALEHLEAIVEISDAIMVARGDLGVEMDFPSVPIAQKRITKVAQREGKPCIIATQMLESMINSPIPTRAEVSDVANAVFDHADTVMLSGETAVGKYPVETVIAMNRTIAAVQSYDTADSSEVFEKFPEKQQQATGAIANAVEKIIECDDIAAIAVFTITGSTARLMSKNRPPCPIIALSPNLETVRRMGLYYGVVAREGKRHTKTHHVLEDASRVAVKLNLAKPGEKIVVVMGRPLGNPGGTNTIVVHTVE
ncbi:MAG: pyruvate kinase [Phycisphaerae bacterium]|nr:pyruvate kinase [Phycisphaerae bacterium]